MVLRISNSLKIENNMHCSLATNPEHLFLQYLESQWFSFSWELEFHLSQQKIVRNIGSTLKSCVCGMKISCNISFQCIPESPASLDDLVQLMARAKKENKNVKATGSLHAAS